MLIIREERPEDAPHTGQLIRPSFLDSQLGYHGEAELVDRLRVSGCQQLSLVAEKDLQVVGYILFTAAHVTHGKTRVLGMGLAPLAILPECQRQGIGSQLVEAGIAKLRPNAAFIIVLGHPEYYRRFGFVTARDYGIQCEFAGVPDEAFMILPFDADSLAGLDGATAKYRPEFRQ